MKKWSEQRAERLASIAAAAAEPAATPTEPKKEEVQYVPPTALLCVTERRARLWPVPVLLAALRCSA